MADNDTITDLAHHYGVTASQVRRALATAKREGRKLTDAYFLDDLSALPKPLGNEEHAEFAELIVAVENLDMLTALWARFAGTATGERIFAAFQKGQALKLEREKHSKARDRRGRPPAVELEVAADSSDAGLVNWFFWLGFGLDGMTTKREKGGRPKLTAAAVAKILRTRKAGRLKGGATTKNGGYAASADNSGRERARKAIRRLFDEDPPRPNATSSKRRSGAATRATFEQMAASILGDRETRRAKREKVWRKKQASRKRIANRTRYVRDLLHHFRARARHGIVPSALAPLDRLLATMGASIDGTAAKSSTAAKSRVRHQYDPTSKCPDRHHRSQRLRSPSSYFPFGERSRRVRADHWRVAQPVLRLTGWRAVAASTRSSARTAYPTAVGQSYRVGSSPVVKAVTSQVISSQSGCSPVTRNLEREVRV